MARWQMAVRCMRWRQTAHWRESDRSPPAPATHCIYAAQTQQALLVATIRSAAPINRSPLKNEQILHFCATVSGDVLQKN